jgi:hypothetical protein
VRTAFAVIALVFFFLPLGLRGVGLKAHEFENRRMAAAPSLSDGWNVFDEATQFFVDRMPLREQAVRANTWASTHIFGTVPDYGRDVAGTGTAREALPFARVAPTAQPAAKPKPAPGSPQPGQPAPSVIRGRHGWLFLEDELKNACTPSISWSVAIARWERLAATVRASGRRVLVAFPPDKSTINPEYLPASYPESACLPRAKAQVWRTIESARDPAILGLRRAMLAAKRPPPDELYFPADSHWDRKGAVLGLTAMLAHLGGPAQVRPADIRRGRTTQIGDLTVLVGAPRKTSAPAWTIARPVAAATRTKEVLPHGGKSVVRTRPAGGAPLLPGRTLLIYDSYGELMIPALSKYTRQLSASAWFDTQPDDVIEAIARADTVIVE